MCNSGNYPEKNFIYIFQQKKKRNACILRGKNNSLAWHAFQVGKIYNEIGSTPYIGHHFTWHLYIKYLDCARVNLPVLFSSRGGIFLFLMSLPRSSKYTTGFIISHTNKKIFFFNVSHSCSFRIWIIGCIWLISQSNAMGK